MSVRGKKTVLAIIILKICRVLRCSSRTIAIYIPPLRTEKVIRIMFTSRFRISTSGLTRIARFLNHDRSVSYCSSRKVFWSSVFGPFRTDVSRTPVFVGRAWPNRHPPRNEISANARDTRAPVAEKDPSAVLFFPSFRSSTVPVRFSVAPRFPQLFPPSLFRRSDRDGYYYYMIGRAGFFSR